MRLYWSPEQIAGRLRRDHNKTIICHETIYRYIYEKVPELKQYLRQEKEKYRRRHSTKARTDRAKKQMKKQINTSPEIIETRERISDWERDTIVGKERKLAILTHFDRKSGYFIANKLNKITADYVNKITMKSFKNIPDIAKKAITYDNGSTFSRYEFIERDTSIDVYFAFPYHSWERGTNENTNRLLRQFYPEKSPFKNITQINLDKYVNLINNRPRKRLHYNTHLEVFYECCTSS